MLNADSFEMRSHTVGLGASESAELGKDAPNHASGILPFLVALRIFSRVWHLYVIRSVCSCRLHSTQSTFYLV